MTRESVILFSVDIIQYFLCLRDMIFRSVSIPTPDRKALSTCNKTQNDKSCALLILIVILWTAFHLFLCVNTAIFCDDHPSAPALYRNCTTKHRGHGVVLLTWVLTPNGRSGPYPVSAHTSASPSQPSIPGFFVRYRKVTMCCVLSVSSGEKVCDAVPLVMPCSTAQRTAL